MCGICLVSSAKAVKIVVRIRLLSDMDGASDSDRTVGQGHDCG